jgi:VIT1/CCC1 family predicted Fe2+/Mn2+ transporter
VADDVGVKNELQSAIEARKELDEEMEPAVVDAFVTRIEQRLSVRRDDEERALQRKRNHQKEMVLGSMGIAVPLLLFAAIFTGLAGVIAVCVALVAIAAITAR